jgi:hypothetical protein
MEKEWLQEKLTVEDIEQSSLKELESYRKDWIGTDKYKPFGMNNDRWEAMKSMAQPGDEFWSFCSEPLSWSMLCGRAGYSLVRNGEIIHSIITAMN